MRKAGQRDEAKELPEKVAQKWALKGGRPALIEEFFADSRFPDLLGGDRFLLIDGGAKGGVEREWIPLTHLLEVIAFEPLWPQDEEARLVNLDIGDHVDPPKERTKFKRFPSKSSLLPMALDRERGRRTFHELRGPSMSSFLPPDRARWTLYGLGDQTRVMRSFEVETTTLDAVVEDRGLRFVDFIKLDTQGSELDILQGSPTTVGKLAFGIRVEAAFVPLYEGQPYFADIDLFMRGHGFEFIDFVHSKRLYRPHPANTDENGDGEGRRAPAGGQLAQADPLYFRSSNAVVEHVTALSKGERARYLGGAVVACLVYSRPDYALDLIERTNPLVSKKAANTARELVLAFPRVA